MLALTLVLVMRNVGNFLSRVTLFVWAIVLTMAMLIDEAACQILAAQGPDYAVAHAWFNAVGFALSPFIAIVLAGLFDARSSRWSVVRCVALIPNVVLSFASLAFPLVFFVSSDNTYERGPFFFVYVITFLYAIVILLAANVRKLDRLPERDSLFFFLLSVFLLVSCALQTAMPALRTTWPCVSVVLVLYYAFLRENQFRYDPVTKVLNRSAYESRKEELHLLKTAGIATIDVFRFKDVNDSFGHQEGDECLRTVALAAQEAFSGMGDCYRMGGDEFCVVAPGADDSSMKMALRSMVEILERERKNLPSLPHVSYGYAIYCAANRESFDEAFARADASMYEYKEAQRTRAGEEPERTRTGEEPSQARAGEEPERARADEEPRSE